jgi:hypothetical protein
MASPNRRSRLGVYSGGFVPTNIPSTNAATIEFPRVGSYGSPDIKTPNLDGLARDGVRLTDFYSNGATCSPTRTEASARFLRRSIGWAYVTTPRRSARSSLANGYHA